MKRVITIILSVIAFITGEQTVLAISDNHVLTFTVFKSTPTSDDHRIDDDPVGHRTPSKPVTCTFDSNGNILLDNNVVKVRCIQIYDEDELLIASPSTNIEFINFIDQSSGLYYIYLMTDIGNYTGTMII